jgi:endonuclease-3
VFPVDSHCFRIAQRLGWIPKEVYLTDRRADELQAGVPQPLRRDLHVGMVLLGRNYCLAKNSRCTDCPLLELCPISSGATI